MAPALARRLALALHWIAWQCARAAVVLSRAGTRLAGPGGAGPEAAGIDADLRQREARLCQWRSHYESYRDHLRGRPR